MCRIRLAVWATALSIGLSFSQPKPVFSQDLPSGTLRFRLSADPGTFDWNLAHTSHETYLIMNLMEGLVEEGPDLQPMPALAEKWDVSADGLVYIFYLRKGVVWSDGKPLIAQHFVDSWLRLMHPKTRSRSGTFLNEIVNAQAFHEGKIKDPDQVGVKAVDDHKLLVTLRRRVPYFLHLPTFWVTFPIRKDLIARHGARWWKPGKIATLGPYVLDAWDTGKSIRLKRNPAYYMSGFTASNAPAEVIARIEPDEKKARAAFFKGELDVLLEPKTSDLVQLGSKDDYQVARFPYLATYYLGFDLRSGPTLDRNVRQALALAIDRAKLPAELQGGQAAARGWIPPGMSGYDSQAHLEGSLYEARGALVKAGFKEGIGFPLLRIWIERFDGAHSLGEFLVRSFRQNLGIESVFIVESPNQFDAAKRKNHAQVFVRHWGADFPDPANFMEVFYSKGGSNYPAWKNAEYDLLLEKARNAAAPSERLGIFKAAEKMLLQDYIVIYPVFYRQNSAIVSRRLKELKISPLNYLFFKSLRLN